MQQLINSRASARELLKSLARHPVLLAKKKKCSKRVDIFFGRVSANFPNFSFFLPGFFILFFSVIIPPRDKIFWELSPPRPLKIHKFQKYFWNRERLMLRIGDFGRAICSQDHLPSKTLTPSSAHSF